MKDSNTPFRLTANLNQESIKQLTQTMLELQGQINSQIDTQWRSYAHPWYRAAWTECAELLDHHGWKWWKKQEPDTPQIHLELVDIWHFALSDLLQHETDIDAISNQISSSVSRILNPPNEFLKLVEKLSEHCLTSKRIDINSFFDLMICVQMNYLELFKQYVGKNVLNRFRQDKGYKTGEYQKTWNGKEDNVHLSEILAQIDFEGTTAPEMVYQALESRYPTPSAEPAI